MGEVTITMSEHARGFLERSQLGETAQALMSTADQLLGLRDAPVDDDPRAAAVRLDDARTAIESAQGDLEALAGVLSPIRAEVS